MYFVYILYSSKFNRKYVGLTSDLNKRLKEHNPGFTKSTKPFIPWKIVFFEEYFSIQEAGKREKYFKSAAGRRYIKQNIKLAS